MKKNKKTETEMAFEARVIDKLIGLGYKIEKKGHYKNLMGVTLSEEKIRDVNYLNELVSVFCDNFRKFGLSKIGRVDVSKVIAHADWVKEENSEYEIKVWG